MISEPQVLLESSRVIEEQKEAFQAMGLRFKETALETNSTIGTLRRIFVFANKTTGRELSISIAALNDDKSVFTAFVRREDGRNFAVSDWLRYHNQKIGCPEFFSEGSPVVILSAFSSFVEDIRVLAQTVLSPYISATFWESVPIDLSPYK